MVTALAQTPYVDKEIKSFIWLLIQMFAAFVLTIKSLWLSTGGWLDNYY